VITKMYMELYKGEGKCEVDVVSKMRERERERERWELPQTRTSV